MTTSCNYCANLSRMGDKPQCLKGHTLGTLPVFVGEFKTDLRTVLRCELGLCRDLTARRPYRPTRFEKILYDPVL